MHIVVCIKQVPDPQAPEGTFYVDEAANEPRWSPPAEAVISTFDLHALEAAARLRDETGARVTVLSLGPPEVEPLLRRALAGGADDALRVEAEAGDDHDRLATAGALAAAVRHLGEADLVICGRLAADWDMGHVPMMLAELLGFAAATPVVGIEAHDGYLTVERLTDDGREVAEVPLPCLLAVSNELNEPRYPTLRSVLDAQRKAVTVLGAGDLGLPPASGGRVRLHRLLGRDLTRECNILAAETPEEGAAQLADLLTTTVLV